MYSEIFIYFQKPIIAIFAKSVVTFRISCLLTVLSETEENFNIYVLEIEENVNNFMDGCFTAWVWCKLGKI